MNFRRQVTSALAWAGLVIVIAVPAAETISSKLLSSSVFQAAPATAEAPAKPVDVEPEPVAAATKTVKAPIAPVEQPKVVVAAAPAMQPGAASSAPVQSKAEASATPVATEIAAQPAAAPAPGANENPVQDYLATNKKLPSYITTAPSPQPTADTSAMTPTAQRLASTLASGGGEPAPATIAPSGSTMAIPAASSGASAVPGDGAVANGGSPVVAPVPRPMPVSSRPKIQPGQTVTEADLKDWKSGTLEDYLKSRGLLSNPSADQGSGN